MVAGGEVAAAVIHERRLDLSADVRHVSAPWMEAAAGRWIDRAWHVALEDDPLALVGQIRIRDRDGREQGLRVGHDRSLVEIFGRRDLDELPQVHDSDPVAHVADDPEVVRDEDVGEGELLLEIVQQVQHLGLDRDVEGRDRLVRDDQLRIEGEGPSDADPLPLAARELVGKAVVVLGGEADRLEQLLHPLAALGLVVPVDLERRSDDRADALARVQARVGILEDHLHVPPQGPERPGAELRDVSALEDDRALRRLEQPDDRAAERRFAAAGLADEADRLPRAHGEGHVVDGVNSPDLALEQALPDREVLLDVVDR